MPAPTTSTSTSAWRARCRRSRFRSAPSPTSCRHRPILYRPVSLRLRSVRERGPRVAIVDQKWSALPVPYAMEVPDRVPKERYFDPDFYQMEADQLWPRVWQMACRLEEIPQPRDFVEYEFLDQSIVVVRTDDLGCDGVPERVPPPWRQGRRGTAARANADSRARSTAGATGRTARTRPCHADGGRSPSTTWWPRDLDLTPVRCEVWGGCAWINLDDDAPPVRRVPRAGRHRASTRGRSSRSARRSGTRAASR